MTRWENCLGDHAPSSGNHSQSKSNIEDLSQTLEIRVKSDSGGFLCTFFKKGRKAGVQWTPALRRLKRSGDRKLWKHPLNVLIEDCLAAKLARNFAKAEDNGFINGKGIHEPTGILDKDKGAECTVTTDAMTFDNVISLCYALESDYRASAIWMMNSNAALKLRTMKDDDGNYLLNAVNDAILGKPVIISEYMPSEESGAIPIVFGDFSYYWIIRRSPFSITVLRELFIAHVQTGYLAYEYLDGKSVRMKAVQGIRIGSSSTE